MARRPTPEASIGQRIRERRQLRGWSIRYTAERAGIAHTTLSRIERGLLSADNRFLLADIAAALECEIGDLTGTPVASMDPAVVSAQAAVNTIRQALIEVDLEEKPGAPTAPLPELRQRADLIRDLFYRYDYAGIGNHLPALLRQLHAEAVAGTDRAEAMRLLVEVTHDAGFTLRFLGHGGDQWLAAERCWQVAQTLNEPAALATAAFARSHAATGSGAYVRGLRLAERAVDEISDCLSAPDALPLLGMLQLTCAYATRALRRDSDSRAWVNEAANVANRTGETTVMHFGPTNVSMWRVMIEADGGDPELAASIAQETRPSIVPAVSRQTDFHIDTARVLARLHRDQAAIRHLLTAERIGPQMVRSSALVRETARAMLDRAQRKAGGTELRGLCERVGIDSRA